MSLRITKIMQICLLVRGLKLINSSRMSNKSELHNIVLTSIKAELIVHFLDQQYLQQITIVTIMCRNDEFSWLMSLVGCLPTDSVLPDK